MGNGNFFSNDEKPLFMDESGHLNEEIIRDLGTGMETWGSYARHLKACSQCQGKVEESTEQFMLQEAGKTQISEEISPDKKRVNKTGRSHPGYIEALLRV